MSKQQKKAAASAERAAAAAAEKARQDALAIKRNLSQFAIEQEKSRRVLNAPPRMTYTKFDYPAEKTRAEYISARTGARAETRLALAQAPIITKNWAVFAGIIILMLFIIGPGMAGLLSILTTTPWWMWLGLIFILMIILRRKQ